MAPRKQKPQDERFSTGYIKREPWSHRYTVIPEHQRNSGVRDRNLWELPQRKISYAAGSFRCLTCLCGCSHVPEKEYNTKGRRTPVIKQTLTPHSVLSGEIEDGNDPARSHLALPYGPQSLPSTTYPAWAAVWYEGLCDIEEETPEDEVARAEESVAHGPTFSLKNIPTDGPTYTIRTGKLRRKRSAPESDDWDVVSLASACSFVRL